MPGYVALPAYRAQSPFDFTGLNAGIDEYNKKLERNRLLEQAQAVGAALIPGTATPATTDPTALNPLMAPQSVPASPAQASAAAAGRIIGAESGGDPNARNPNSSATGAGQFINSTWLDTVKRNRPDLASGKSDAEILSLRSNPNLSREMTGAYAAQNSKLLQSAGFASTPGNTYLAHFAGPGGASAVLRADPSTPVTQILSPAAVAANPHIANMTAGDLRSWADRKMGGAPAISASGAFVPAATTTAPGLSQGIDYLAGARAAAKQGNVALAVELLGKQQEQAKSLREEQTFKDAHLKAVAAHVGNMANTVALEPDKAKQTAMWRNMVATDPEIAQGLRQNGIDPNDVEAGTRFMINQARGITDKLGKDRYVVAGKRIFDTTTQQFISSPDGAAGGDEEFAKQITYGLDEQGNAVALQASDKANLAASKLPPGIKIAGKDPIRLDGGDRWILLDPVTRQKIGEILKNVAAEAQQKEIGKLSADAQAALPAAKTSVDDAVRLVGKLRTHPGLDVATGLSSVADPRNFTPGSDAYNFNVLNKQEVSKTFMAAREGLKGAGQVTDFEGNKGQDAIGRLNTAQSKPAYLEALDDVERMMKSSYSDLEKKAGMFQPAGQTKQPPAAAPTGRPRAVNKAGAAVEYNEQTGKWEAAP